MEIEVGEYVRNEDGYIQKITSFDKQTNIYKDENGDLRIWEGEDVWGNEYSSAIVKHSKKIIDLIEEGDFVNDSEVVIVYGYDEDGNDKDELGIVTYDGDDAIYYYLSDIQIRTILTHEQYAANAYKLEKEG